MVGGPAVAEAGRSAGWSASAEQRKLSAAAGSEMRASGGVAFSEAYEPERIFESPKSWIIYKTHGLCDCGRARAGPLSAVSTPIPMTKGPKEFSAKFFFPP